MKIVPTGIIILFTVASPSIVAVEFIGYAYTGSEWRFVLREDGTEKSEWVRIGDAYAGYRLTAFDLKTEELTVEKDGEATCLPLPIAKSRGSAQPAKWLDPRIFGTPDEITIRYRHEGAARTIEDPKLIQRVIELLRGSVEERRKTAMLRLRREYTHIILMPEPWFYDASTGQIARDGRIPPPITIFYIGAGKVELEQLLKKSAEPTPR